MKENIDHIYGTQAENSFDGARNILLNNNVFGKVGAMRWSSDNTSGSQDGFGVTYGLGAKMSLNETTKLRAEWEKLPNIETSASDKTDVNMLSVGVELSTY